MNLKLKAALLTGAGLLGIIALTFIVQGIFTFFTVSQICFAIGVVAVSFAIYSLYRVVLTELQYKEEASKI